MDLSKRVLARRERKSARPRWQGRRVPGSKKVRQGRPPEGHPPREGNALRGLPFPGGQPRRWEALRRDAGRREDSLRRLSWGLRRTGDPAAFRRNQPRLSSDGLRTALSEAPRQDLSTVGAGR